MQHDINKQHAEEKEAGQLSEAELDQIIDRLGVDGGSCDQARALMVLAGQFERAAREDLGVWHLSIRIQKRCLPYTSEGSDLMDKLSSGPSPFAGGAQ